MGTYLNPGNEGFQEILQSEYVDKILTWHEEEGTAHIPNEEVRIEFEKILEGTEVSRKWIELIGRSQKFLEDTIAGNSEAVAEAIQAIRDTQYASAFYNDEQALRYMIKFA